MAENNTEGRWVTLDNGVHLFIKKGQTLDDAIEKLETGTSNEELKKKSFDEATKAIKEKKALIEKNEKDPNVIKYSNRKEFIKEFNEKHGTDYYFDGEDAVDENGRDIINLGNGINKKELEKKLLERKEINENGYNGYGIEVDPKTGKYTIYNKKDNYYEMEKPNKDKTFGTIDEVKEYIDKKNQSSETKETIKENAKKQQSGETKPENYKGYDIEKDSTGDANFSVKFKGVEVLFDSKDEAKAFIDRKTDTTEQDDYKNLSAEEYGKKYGKADEPKKSAEIKRTGDVKADIKNGIRNYFSTFNDDEYDDYIGGYVNVDTEERSDG